MVIDEKTRHRLFSKLEAVLGTEDATALMEHLPPVGWADVATKQDLARLDQGFLHLREHLDDRLETLEHRLVSKMFRNILLANSASLLTMAGLAFSAARLV